MPWYVGVDEAGYGPNLGPCTQAAVACKLPDTEPTGFVAWEKLIRRAGKSTRGDKRPIVDDSKLVHSGKKGNEKLEIGLGALFGLEPTLEEFLAEHGLKGTLDDLKDEFWFDPSAALPSFGELAPDLRPLLREQDSEARIIGIKATVTSRFNSVVEASGSKGTVLAIGLHELLVAAREKIPGKEKLTILCDKQGGRSHYAPFLQEAFPDSWVTTEVENAEESRYQITMPEREIVIQFTPRADSASVAVALASMLAKYLRELCMKQFNAWWCTRFPELKPTAGYPQDARRFLADVQPSLESLGIDHRQLWRVK